MSATALSRYVARNPEILSGEPIITGTRTSVRAIVGLWRLGIMPEEIMNENKQHSGIIIVPQKNAYEVAKRISVLVSALTVEETNNQLLYA